MYLARACHDKDTSSIPWEIETAALLGEASPAGFDELDVLMGEASDFKIFSGKLTLQVIWITPGDL